MKFKSYMKICPKCKNNCDTKFNKFYYENTKVNSYRCFNINCFYYLSYSILDEKIKRVRIAIKKYIVDFDINLYPLIYYHEIDSIKEYTAKYFEPDLSNYTKLTNKFETVINFQ